MRTPQYLIRSLALGVLTALSGCAVLPESFQALEAPAVETLTRHWAGSPLAGQTDHQPEIDPGAPVVSCRVLYLDSLPETLLDPLLKRARLIASGSGSTPINATADLNFKSQIATGQAAVDFLDAISGFFGLGRVPGLGGVFGIRVINLEDMRGLVIPGATTSFVLTSKEPFDVPSLGRIRRRMSVMASRSDPHAPHTIQISVVIQDLLARAEDDILTGPPPPLRTEIVVLDITPEIGGTPIILAAPSPFPGDAPHAFALVLEFHSKASLGASYEAIVAECRADLNAAKTTADLGAPSQAENARRLREIQITFKALEFARDHRNTLIHLATASQANLAEDIALSASEEQLAAYVKRIFQHGGSLMGNSREQLAWRLEESAYAHLADLLDREEISPILAGMFARYAGEAARFPGTMRTILDGCRSMEILQQRLVHENRIFLEDSRPSARVRAYDWLARRDQAPKGFDPLASRDRRRKALASLNAEVSR